MNQFSESSTEYGNSYNSVFSNINVYGDIINRSVNIIELSVCEDNNSTTTEDFHDDFDMENEFLLVDTAANNSDDSSQGSNIQPYPSRRRRYVYTESDSDSDIENTTNPVNWSVLRNTIYQPNIFNFSSSSREVGPNFTKNCNEPIDYFNLFFTDDLITSIVQNTNDYAKNKIESTQLSNNSI